ncbi:hypothetical protein J5T34_10215 [Cupriavidus gilardii]|uniref:hypothetical protein n=1 Tax=Cupriavidus gilardii TaxID=82541 RepID=UPI001ABDCD15|nr:hypothetical protein [Cupriavidus gilardii]MBO4121098.1 hypothetical protein [Cupriavidus gilardii]
MDIPQIPTRPNLNAVDGIPLPSSTPWGNLTLKYMVWRGQLHFVNIEVRRAFELHHADDANRGILLNQLHAHFVAEQTVQAIKRLADELVAMIEMLRAAAKANTYPRMLKIDGIGPLLEKDGPTWFDEIRPGVELLNSVANAQKHSFLNREIIMRGLGEPWVFTLSVDRNRLSKELTFMQVPLRAIVDTFIALVRLGDAELWRILRDQEHPLPSDGFEPERRAGTPGSDILKPK